MNIHSTGRSDAVSESRAEVGTTNPTLVPVSTVRWRVLVGGRIIGHLDELTDDDGARFRASRYRRATGTLVSVGDFFRQRDAIDALRYAG